MPDQEQRVGDDSAGKGSLDQKIFARFQSCQRDDEFRQVAEGGVEQSANRVAGPRGKLFRGER